VPCCDPRGFDVNLWVVAVTICLLFPVFLVLPFFNSVFFPFSVLLSDDLSILQPLTGET
jgi:hypothetical protein